MQRLHGGLMQVASSPFRVEWHFAAIVLGEKVAHSKEVEE
jgi:hypothetical protein